MLLIPQNALTYVKYIEEPEVLEESANAFQQEFLAMFEREVNQLKAEVDSLVRRKCNQE